MASAARTFVDGGVPGSTMTLPRAETAAADIWCNLAMDWPNATSVEAHTTRSGLRRKRGLGEFLALFGGNVFVEGSLWVPSN